jgi:hypothetical protein
MTTRRFRGGAFGRQFAGEIVRLGVPLSAPDIRRLSVASEDKVLSAVRQLLPAMNPQLLDLSARRGPKSLAGDVARSYRPPGKATEALDTALTVDGIAWSLGALSDALSSIDIV